MRALIFPGQGAQSVGMLSDYVNHQKFAQSLSSLSEASGLDLLDLGQNGPLERINQTEITQPLVFAYSIALLRTFAAQVADVTLMAGHSLGEYTALAASGMLTPEEIIKVVCKRGELMQNAVPLGEGKMMAVLGADKPVIAKACQMAAEQANGICEIANINAPGQIVIAGQTRCIELILNNPAEFGLKRLRLLDVSVPSHCSLMNHAGQELASLLRSLNLKDSPVSVVQNYTAAKGDSTEVIRQNLVAQLSNPVQWVDSILKMKALGVTEFIECGPGKVLSGMLKRIVPDITCSHISSL